MYSDGRWCVCRYAGRFSAASTATGNKQMHLMEVAGLIEAAMTY